jgi:catechol 2,3-dioxygenase-like lactoylglutathione lyase family enzyme
VAHIPVGGVHHIALTVSDVDRSKAFYCDLLGFKEVAPLPTGVIVGNGQVLLGLRTAPERALPDDRFDPNRIGLDHLSLSIDSKEQLEQAAKRFAISGVECGEQTDLAGFGIAVLMIRDPDNIQIELTAPSSA